MTSTITLEEEKKLAFYSFYRICVVMNEVSVDDTNVLKYLSICLKNWRYIEQATRIFHHKLNDGILTIKFYAGQDLTDIKSYWRHLHQTKSTIENPRQVVNKRFSRLVWIILICYIRKVLNMPILDTIEYLKTKGDSLFDIIPEKFGEKLENWTFSHDVVDLRYQLGITYTVEPLERIVLPAPDVNNEEINHALQIVRDKCIEIRAASKVGIIINIFINC